MTTELSPQSRIKVLDIPVAAPGTCILCGTAGIDDRKFVDFGKTVDWIGVIYFCTECISEVARAVGWVPVAEFDKLLQELKKVQADKGIVEAKYSGVTSALDTLFANYDRGIVSVDDFVRGSVSASEAELDFQQGLDKEFATGEPETNESANVEGSDDFFDASDFEQ